eukprot:c54603_g1_i1.p1 GENE.c54603_g1_i1~~c54603_g1_i1.p1  ORF type:complete len:206 (-),score=48.66 c54603_g1_i1:20-637(-)
MNVTTERIHAVLISLSANNALHQQQQSLSKVSDFVWACPPFEILQYIQKVSHSMRATEQTLVATAVLLSRIHLESAELFCTRSLHKLFLAVAVIASKWCEDGFYSNTHYAKSGVVSLDCFNKIELAAVNLLGWDLTVSRAEYEAATQIFATTHEICTLKVARDVHALQVVSMAERSTSVAPAIRHGNLKDCDDDEGWEFRIVMGI